MDIFSHWFVVKIVFVWKDENKWKREAGDGPFLKKILWNRSDLTKQSFPKKKITTKICNFSRLFEEVRKVIFLNYEEMVFLSNKFDVISTNYDVFETRQDAQ